MRAPISGRRPSREARPPAPEGRRGERGQGLVEFVMVLPLIMLLLGGVVEIGLVANDTLTIGYGSREGARAGSALGDGGATSCEGDGDPAGVDATVVAGVQRIIESSGAAVKLSDIEAIHIFKATASGDKVEGRVNTWRWTGPDSGPDVDPGAGVSLLEFSPPEVAEWPACQRINGGSSPDILGVEVVYRRALVSPLASLLSSFGIEPAMTLSETTVMTLNPSF